MRSLLFTKLLVLTLVIILSGLRADAQDRTAVIKGYVLDGNGAIFPGADIEAIFEGSDAVPALTLKTKSDFRGDFSIERAPAGKYLIYARMTGQETSAVKFVTVKPGQVFSLEILFPQSFDACSGISDDERFSILTEEERISLVRMQFRLLRELLELKYRIAPGRERTVVSTKNIEPGWLGEDELKHFEPLDYNLIKDRADKQGATRFITLEELEFFGNCAKFTIRIDKSYGSSPVISMESQERVYEFIRFGGSWHARITSYRIA